MSRDDLIREELIRREVAKAVSEASARYDMREACGLLGLVFEVPPYAQGQAVERAYAIDPVPGGVRVVRRTTDWSDYQVRYDEAHPAHDLEPVCNWTREPAMRWRVLEGEEVQS